MKPGRSSLLCGGENEEEETGDRGGEHKLEFDKKSYNKQNKLICKHCCQIIIRNKNKNKQMTNKGVYLLKQK